MFINFQPRRRSTENSDRLTGIVADLSPFTGKLVIDLEAGYEGSLTSVKKEGGMLILSLHATKVPQNGRFRLGDSLTYTSNPISIWRNMALPDGGREVFCNDWQLRFTMNSPDDQPVKADGSL